MKKIKYSILSLALLSAVTSCDLETLPSDKLGTEQMTSSVDGCMSALNGVYRGFYTTQYSDGYPTENFGPASVNLAADVMGDDFIEREFGSKWFTYDHLYWVRSEIHNTSDRPYTWWNMYYQFVNNANAVLDKIDTAEGTDEALRNSVKGQALALRAYAYFNLARWYQRTYVGHESDPGVPLYTKPTVIKTEGKGRGLLSDVYKQINDDLDAALPLLKEGKAQMHKSHIDYYVASGLKSRVALVQENWQVAADAAKEALSKPGLSLMRASELTNGFNSVGNNEWMWGSEINDTQNTNWYSFFNHMDASAGGHARSCRKVVSIWLYNRIDDDDIRKQWFVAPTQYYAFKDKKADIKAENDAQTAGLLLPEEVSYNQLKFRVKAIGSWSADYLYMRGAEMVLNRAEALCNLGQYNEARTLLSDLIGSRYTDAAKYQTHLATLSDSKELTLKSTESTDIKTLKDEIILQRRIELWGEGFRILDVMRLKSGFNRVYDNHNVTGVYADISIKPDSWDPIMQIPISEFDGNPSLNVNTDQNP